MSYYNNCMICDRKQAVASWGVMQLIRLRIETPLRERGVKWSDVYSKLEWHKSFASAVLNGKKTPPLWQRQALARVLTELGGYCSPEIIWSENHGQEVNNDTAKM